MPEVVYVLCFLTSAGCSWLLLSRYAKTKSRLLFWTGLCFVSMAINNAVLFVDRELLPPEVDMFWPRILPILAGLLCLLYGLIWEAE